VKRTWDGRSVENRGWSDETAAARAKGRLQLALRFLRFIAIRSRRRAPLHTVRSIADKQRKHTNERTAP
jgi:hypothetical protein